MSTNNQEQRRRAIGISIAIVVVILLCAATAWGLVWVGQEFGWVWAGLATVILWGTGYLILRSLRRAAQQQNLYASNSEFSIPPEFLDELRQADDDEQRYLQTGQAVALDSAVAAQERILEHPSLAQVPERTRLVIMNDAGSVFLRRYWRSGQLHDLERALHLWQQVVSLAPQDSHELAGYLNNLGNGLRARYGRAGAIADLEEAIRIYQQAVNITPLDSPNLPDYLNNLGTGLSDHYHHTGVLADIEEAIRVYQQAVSGTPPDSRKLPGHLNNLGIGLHIRYNHIGDMKDLEEAIHIFRQVVNRTPPDAPDMPGHLNTLGMGLHNRYHRLGALDDLEEAIHIFEQAVEFTSPTSPKLPYRLIQLGAGLSARYYRTGIFADLEKNISVSRQAVHLTPTDSPELPGALNNLGNTLWMRYHRTGMLADLEEAIHVYKLAVESTSPDSPVLPYRLNNLSSGLHDRYSRTGALEDLEESIRVVRQALSCTPPGSPTLQMYLNNLGTGLQDRYYRTGTLIDLEEAIHSYQQAASCTSADAPELSAFLTNLGCGLWTRYRLTEALIDLEEAIRYWQRAVDHTPPDSPALPRNLNNLCNGLRDRYHRTGKLADLEEAIRLYEQACQSGSQLSQEVTLISSRAWGNWALERQSWQEACHAYAYGLQASEVLFQTQFDRASKEAWLKEFQDLPANAAYAQARLGQQKQALSVLESGRTRLLREALERSRCDLERLAEIGHADLLRCYRESSARFNALTHPLSSSSMSGEPPINKPADLLQQLESAQIDVQVAIADIRHVSGYEDFLLSLSVIHIQELAKDAPLVYLASSLAGGCALIVTPNDVQAVWLDGLTEAVLRERLQGPVDDPEMGGYQGVYNNWLRTLADQQASTPAKQAAILAWHTALDEITAWLWQVAMQQVVAHLHTMGAQQAVLIPGGLLGLLPLHAAWTDDVTTPTGRRYVMDEITFTYAPSARALLEAKEVTARAMPNELLAIDNPDGTLPSSSYEVAAALAGFDQAKPLAGSAATRQAVLDALPHYPVLHFSTHGQAGWQNPLADSKIKLADGDLTLGELLDLRLPGARLAVLSACETGIPGSKLPDEVVSLPSGLLQAGVAGVAASLWSVQDLSTAMLMARFYELWRKDGLSLPEALRQAQIWLRDTTNGEKKEYFKASLPELAGVHMPADVAEVFYKAVAWEDDVARSFAHPFYWAAFTYTGV